MTLVWVIFWIFFVTFLLIVFRGAPFVPTRQRDILKMFDLVNFRPGEVFVDLGSGDGRVLAEAARRGVMSVGYELNPFLAYYSRFRLRRMKSLIRVRTTDFWLTPLPERTKVVFVFLASPYMKRLDKKLQREAARLGHSITLVSYSMPIPGREPDASDGALLVYRYNNRPNR